MPHQLLHGDEGMPRQLLHDDEKVGAISSGVAALHTSRGGELKMRAPSRLWNQMPSTTVTRAKADAGTNAQTSARQQFWSEHATKRSAKEKATMSPRMVVTHQAKQTDLNGERPADENLHKGSSGEIPQKHQAKLEIATSQLRHHPPGVQIRGAGDVAIQLVTIGEESKSNKFAAHQQLKTRSSSRRLSARTRRPLDSNGTGKDCKESRVKDNTTVHVPKCNDLQEADDEIQRLNKLGLGEDISPDEYMEYFNKLPDDPVVNTYFKLNYEQMIPLYIRHARYRINYYKLSQRKSTDRQDYDVDLLEKEDFSEEFLREKGYFVKFEKDGTFDWSFDPDLCNIRDLDDYQRLVPHDKVGCDNYYDWDSYRESFHSYGTEKEYLDYCSELSKQLKWMEDYVLIEVPSHMWGKISTRGAFQAMKIATAFSKITPSLVDNGYYECVHNMRFNAFPLKYLVDFYFEIWVLVCKQEKSMKYVVEELYNLNKFPPMIFKLLNALEDCSELETEFRTFTNNVNSGVSEEEARSLITEAVKKVERPKFYEDYIRKKIDIAQAIGLIPVV